MTDDERETQHLPTPSLWPIGFAIGSWLLAFAAIGASALTGWALVQVVRPRVDDSPAVSTATLSPQS